jgi:hypothetical protein
MIEGFRFRREYVFGLFAVSGCLWALFYMGFWVLGPESRILAAIFSVITSWLLMYGGLKILRVSIQRLPSEAMLAVLPWNGVYLYQLAYIGHVFIPFEIVATSMILRKRIPLTLWKAILLATLVRAIAFALIRVGEKIFSDKWPLGLF